MTTDAERVGLSEGFAQVNGIRLHYVEAGEGPLVVLLQPKARKRAPRLLAPRKQAGSGRPL
jgi:hypothetical protein